MLTSIAIIPDGNRRYAERNSLSLEQAYIKGFDKAEEVLRWCNSFPDLKNIVLYALSYENLQRDKLQLSVLFKLYKIYLKKLADSGEVKQNKIRVHVIGDKSALKDIEKEINYVENKTKDFTEKNLYIAFAYSGQKELFDAVKKASSEKEVFENLQMPANIDLVIRTSGRQRLSNFLLWQSAYAELFFVDHLWPELTKQDFTEAVEFFDKTQRNLGK